MTARRQNMRFRVRRVMAIATPAIQNGAGAHVVAPTQIRFAGEKPPQLRSASPPTKQDANLGSCRMFLSLARSAPACCVRATFLPNWNHCG